MGEMLSEIPKASGARTDLQPNRTDADRLKPKSQVLKELHIRQDTAERYQQMAAHPEIVEQAIADIQSGLYTEFHPIR